MYDNQLTFTHRRDTPGLGFSLSFSFDQSHPFYTIDCNVIALEINRSSLVHCKYVCFHENMQVEGGCHRKQIIKFFRQKNDSNETTNHDKNHYLKDFLQEIWSLGKYAFILYICKILHFLSQELNNCLIVYKNMKSKYCRVLHSKLTVYFLAKLQPSKYLSQKGQNNTSYWTINIKKCKVKWSQRQMKQF